MLDINSLIQKIIFNVSDNAYWYNKLNKKEFSSAHLALMTEPCLTHLLNGEKTIESRFSRNKIAPYGKVSVGDVIIIKRSCGPILGVFEASAVEYIEFSADSEVLAVKEKYNSKILAPEDFWSRKLSSRYATLIDVGNLYTFEPIPISWINRQSWITMRF